MTRIKFALITLLLALAGCEDKPAPAAAPEAEAETGAQALGPKEEWPLVWLY